MGSKFVKLWSILEVGQNQSDLEVSSSVKVSRRATVARVLAIEGSNGLLAIHMEARHRN